MELIFKAESIGFKLKKAVHVSSIIGDVDFDLVMPISEQETWLSASTRFDTDTDGNLPKIILPESQQLRFSKNFDQFTKHPLAQNALVLLTQYVHECVTAPRRTEYSFWSVSCSC